MIAELKRKLATTLMEKSSLMAESVVTVEPTAMGDAMGDHVDEKDNIIKHLKTQVQFPHCCCFVFVLGNICNHHSLPTGCYLYIF